MTSVRLTGLLICETSDQVQIVIDHLPLHVELTRSEPGCVSFEVARTKDPHVWQVDEQFMDAASFAAHQQRVAASEWGRATAGIERRYEVDGLR
ncbi:putative quinol monooxygenase [Agreia pratensis]|uniref:Quinol monooxygenase YgiN n=1 Tax=Agreia pratensis TaxID=150121 RepID=A0A1X7IZG5_9MICO|nr:antibiotic biosynthesis monooxygenase [Agreia pratensis]SMG20593.1 Quinol monooxygenase YgiN [Agreia pratensis]